MTSRDEILASVRKNTPKPTPLPDLSKENWQSFENKKEHFAQMLEFVGGSHEFVSSLEEINEKLSTFPEYQNSKKTCSMVDGVGESTFDLQSVEDPHELEDVDFAILPAEFAIAENGAVWLRGENLPHRVLPFLAQHLSIVFFASEIVDTMHDAYARVSLNKNEFGLFLSGPSKTADIEQSLVIGAHGPRSLIVFIVDA